MMDKYKRLAIIFSVSYATILIILLIEFFVKFFADADINYLLPESVKLSCFLQELLRIDVIHCFASNSSTQFLFVA